MSLMTCLPLATSLHVLPCASRIVSSMFSCSNNSDTTSARPSDAARWSGVVPIPGGCIPLGDIARWERSIWMVDTTIIISKANGLGVMYDSLLEAQWIARWSAAAAVSIPSAEDSSDARLSLPISVKNGCISAGSPECILILFRCRHR